MVSHPGDANGNTVFINGVKYVKAADAKTQDDRVAPPVDQQTDTSGNWSSTAVLSPDVAEARGQFQNVQHTRTANSWKKAPPPNIGNWGSPMPPFVNHWPQSTPTDVAPRRNVDDEALDALMSSASIGETTTMNEVNDKHVGSTASAPNDPDMVEIFVKSGYAYSKHLVHLRIAQQLFREDVFEQMRVNMASAEPVLIDADLPSFNLLLSYLYKVDAFPHARDNAVILKALLTSESGWPSSVAGLYISASYFQLKDVKSIVLDVFNKDCDVYKVIRVAQIVYGSESLDNQFRTHFKSIFVEVFTNSLDGKHGLSADIANSFYGVFNGGFLTVDIADALLQNHVATFNKQVEVNARASSQSDFFDANSGLHATALQASDSECSLQFEAGDVITNVYYVRNKYDARPRMYGIHNKAQGTFPAGYVQIIPSMLSLNIVEPDAPEGILDQEPAPLESVGWSCGEDNEAEEW